MHAMGGGGGGGGGGVLCTFIVAVKELSNCTKHGKKFTITSFQLLGRLPARSTAFRFLSVFLIIKHA